MRIKKGDTILVIQGKSRNKSGKVLAVLPKENRVVVEGVNIVKRHVRPRQQGEKGQIIEKPSPINASNVQVLCSACRKPVRVRMKQSGKDKYRACVKCDGDIATNKS